MIQIALQSRVGEKKQESSTANGNESCIKCSAEGKQECHLFQLGGAEGVRLSDWLALQVDLVKMQLRFSRAG